MSSPDAGIGLSLEDAMKFFRGEFIKKTDVDVDKFEKGLP